MSSSCEVVHDGTVAVAYEEIARDASLLLDEYTHAAHVLLYAEWAGALFGRYPFKYAILMQTRFDGVLGFPGGVVDEGETPEQAVTRELLEETGGGVVIGQDNHISTTFSTKTKFCLHFYAKKISLDKFRTIEMGCPHAQEWGSEVIGVMRCPLYTLPNGLGLPAFLTHNFIGNSRYQLLVAIRRCGLLTEEEVVMAMEASGKVNTLVTTDQVDY